MSFAAKCQPETSISTTTKSLTIKSTSDLNGESLLNPYLSSTPNLPETHKLFPAYQYCPSQWHPCIIASGNSRPTTCCLPSGKNHP